MTETRRRIYLDNAATSWPKPEAVYQAVDRYQRENGAPAGRGVYAQAVEVQQAIAAARRAVARLIGADSPQRVVFTSCGTEALNLAIHGVLTRPGHVITSVVEHNSVLRPLRALEESGRISLTRVPCNDEGVVDPASIVAAWQPDTSLVVLTHASNVTGALQPVAEVGALARERGALFLVDAAQTLGEIPVDVAQLPVDLLAAPGHKGLLGPLGTGLLYIRAGIEQQLSPLRQGGTGTQSEHDRQPQTLPDKYESGNLNVPGILGLHAGIEYLIQQGVAELRRRSMELTERLHSGLVAIPGVRVLGPKSAATRVGIVSVTVAGHDPSELAMLLDMLHGVQTRPGLHCSPLAHRALRTIEQGGALRFSIGCFNTTDDIDQAIRGLREICGASNL
jgi:cysteine desulfurase/selenocysteine lyase